MPAEMPAEVHTSPSLIKMRSASSFTFGYKRAKCAVLSQWVVALRPSSSPASASKKAPEHTLATRRALIRFSHVTIARAAASERTISPPDAMTVSNGP
jgi:hypothetical protein